VTNRNPPPPVPTPEQVGAALREIHGQITQLMMADKFLAARIDALEAAHGPGLTIRELRGLRVGTALVWTRRPGARGVVTEVREHAVIVRWDDGTATSVNTADPGAERYCESLALAR
jgi:hypothetical protein